MGKMGRMSTSLLSLMTTLRVWTRYTSRYVHLSYERILCIPLGQVDYVGNIVGTESGFVLGATRMPDENVVADFNNSIVLMADCRKSQVPGN